MTVYFFIACCGSEKMKKFREKIKLWLNKGKVQHEPEPLDNLQLNIETIQIFNSNPQRKHTCESQNRKQRL